MKRPIAGGSAVALATGLADPAGIAVSGDNVYWADGVTGVVAAVPIAGGTPTTLARGESATFLAVDATNVYYATLSSIMKVPRGGGASATLASLDGDVNALTTDGSAVYWTSTGGTIQKVSAAGGVVTVLARSREPQGIAVANGRVYWTDADIVSGGAVMSVSLSDGTVSTLAPGLDCPWAIAVDESAVYWGACNGTIGSVGLTGGVKVLATNGIAAGSVAPTATSIYFATDEVIGRTTPK
jgi:hypothetical protein